MGDRGPIPKRSDQRRRRNVESRGVDAAPGVVPEIPEAEASWHPLARRWYESLARSGQAAFYQASDWATAMVIAESLSRDLKPQVVGVTDEGEIKTAVIPFKGASLSAYLKAMTALMVTEGDRRRARLELERVKVTEEATPDVSELAVYRRRSRSSTTAGNAS